MITPEDIDIVVERRPFDTRVTATLTYAQETVAVNAALDQRPAMLDDIRRHLRRHCWNAIYDAPGFARAYTRLWRAFAPAIVFTPEMVEALRGVKEFYDMPPEMNRLAPAAPNDGMVQAFDDMERFEQVRAMPAVAAVMGEPPDLDQANALVNQRFPAMPELAAAIGMQLDAPAAPPLRGGPNLAQAEHDEVNAPPAAQGGRAAFEALMERVHNAPAIADEGVPW